MAEAPKLSISFLKTSSRYASYNEVWCAHSVLLLKALTLKSFKLKALNFSSMHKDDAHSRVEEPLKLSYAALLF